MWKLLSLHLLLGAVWLIPVRPALAQPVTFKQVMGRFPKSASDPRLLSKEVDLVFDDHARQLVVKSKDRPIDVAYADVQRAIFEVNPQIAEGVFDMFLGASIGITTGLGEGRYNNLWCYLEYRTPDGHVEAYLLEIASKDARGVVGHMREALGDRAAVVTFPENASVEDIDKDLLPEIHSKHDVKADRDHHPMPELRHDKALIVVVATIPTGGLPGRRQIKIHANDRVTCVNKVGTYCWFYLDPGEYQLVSQSGTASALQITVEAGMDYYFIQTVFTGGFGGLKTKTILTRHTRELVMYELNGAYHSVWSRKK